MSAPRGLSPEEAALWAQLASTVTPIHPKKIGPSKAIKGGAPEEPPPAQPRKTMPARVQNVSRPAPHAPPKKEVSAGLDSHWERRLSRTVTQPDFTLDLHGHTLDQAYRRIDAGLMQAKAMGARLVLVVTGKSRPVDAADRGERRGAIRAKVLDWLAAGQHAADIAAIRPAPRRHGGDGALYLILKRRR
ncbi:hypothetical protein CP97_04220 [Aurantiacibacter atlanticus]|uniref:Smr domain-containing protein n=1 Tax=Aurantiacibacter atlanticus TaxID=1648404 RepID=A0A0H4V9V8_9SPHN|nr:Smr/MutS family protein [Aurantiacibacter atlanticus]AKQ41407.1 hypothetical protein CP97_04220 [Aurantiacibacter atlanticus]